MFRAKLLGMTIIALMALTIFVPAAGARLTAGGPEAVITNSMLILTGKVIESNGAEEERTFTVAVDSVLKGEYAEPEIEFTAKKNPVYGWINIRTLPEKNTELLLFLRCDENGKPYFAFDLNCIAIIEEEQVTDLIDGSNVGINDGHWQIEDYLQVYNDFLHNAEQEGKRTEPVSAAAEHNRKLELSFLSRAAGIPFLWPGIIAFPALLVFSLAALWYCARSKQCSLMFWIAGILVCIAVSYLIATIIFTPILNSFFPSAGETPESLPHFSPSFLEEDNAASTN